MGDQDVQALDPGGHPARADPADLGDGFDLVAAGEVCLVRRRVRRREFFVRTEPVGHLAHQAGRLERADRRRRPGAGQVVQGRERRAVGQPGRGLDDVGIAARAAMSDGADGPGFAAELLRNNRAIRRRNQAQDPAFCTVSHNRLFQVSSARLVVVVARDVDRSDGWPARVTT
jgi:hypothetical protein